MSYHISTNAESGFITWNGCETYFYDTFENQIRKHLIPERVIFNPPATIVYWKDGTKTVVKCSLNEEFVEEVGVAQAIVRKLFEGNRSEFLRIVENAYRQPKDK